MIRAAVVVLLLLLVPGCGGDSADKGADKGDDKGDDEPAVMARSLPPNICAWIPREYLTGLVVNKPTNSDALGVPTSICTAVARKGATRSTYVNVILKRFSSLEEAREDNTEACQTFAELAPKTIEAPGVQALETCARRGETSTYVITVPNDSGDTLLVAIGGTSPGSGLAAAIEITNNITRQLG